MMIAQEYIDMKYPAVLILRFLGISSSTFYYRPTGGRRGRVHSTATLHVPSRVYILSEVIVHLIRWLLNREFVDYGFRKVTHCLRRQGLSINKKKVYRLMREYGLLLARIKARGSGKTWVKELVPNPERPFQHMEVDIKFIHIDRLGRYALLLSVIDVRSRFNMGHMLQYSIQKEDVCELFRHLFHTYDMPDSVTVRSDNGGQFESGLARGFFEEHNVAHEFTKPATPEQNAHIESYHSILQNAVCNHFRFANLDNAQDTLDRFRDFYNFERLHSGIDYRTPHEVLLSSDVIIKVPDSMKHINNNETHPILLGNLSKI